MFSLGFRVCSLCTLFLIKTFGVNLIVMKVNQRKGTIAQTSSDATRNKRVKALAKKTKRPVRKRPKPKTTTNDESTAEVILELPSDSELALDTCPFIDGSRSEKYFIEPCIKIDGTYVDNFWEELHATSESPTPSWSSECESDCEVHRTYHNMHQSPNFWSCSRMSASGNVVKRRWCRFKRRRRKYSLNHYLNLWHLFFFWCVLVKSPSPNLSDAIETEPPRAKAKKKKKQPQRGLESSGEEEGENDFFESSEDNEHENAPESESEDGDETESEDSESEDSESEDSESEEGEDGVYAIRCRNSGCRQLSWKIKTMSAKECAEECPDSWFCPVCVKAFVAPKHRTQLERAMCKVGTKLWANFLDDTVNRWRCCKFLRKPL